MSYEAIEYPVFQPAMRIITAITNAVEAMVTTSFDHQYVNGMQVRLLIPYYYGMVQANGKAGTITVINGTQFTIDLDTTLYDPFLIPIPVLVPDVHAIPPLILTVPLPPYKRLTLYAIDPDTGLRIPLTPVGGEPIEIEEYAQVVPFAQDTEMLTAAVRNVLPYP